MDVESECADPIMSDRCVLVVRVTQRVSRFCTYRHGRRHGSCLGHLIHCTNEVVTIFGKTSRFATHETLAV